MVASPLEIVRTWLQNPLDPEVVNRVIAPDAVYVSANTENAELSKILPWAGTSHGPEAFLDNLGLMVHRWGNLAFNLDTMFASGASVAVFGDFCYQSKSLGHIVTSPFAILAEVFDGQITFLQLLEDSYATASSFRKAGSWTVHTDPDLTPFGV
jgi:hypothetical protein